MLLSDHSALIVGCGSIGRRHLGNLKNLGIQTLAVCDPDKERRAFAKKEFGAQGHSDLSTALEAVTPSVVLICTPPHLHVEQAIAAIEHNAHVFVEKPLSNSLAGIEELKAAATSKHRIVQVGYNLRFNPGLKQVKALLDKNTIGRVMWARAEFGQYLPDWRPWQDYRTSYTADATQGGGIIFDASHEIDYMMWLLGDVAQVHCMAGQLSNLEVSAEDTALIALQFANGCLGQIHLDFVQRARTRNCKFVGTEGTVCWNFVDQTLSVYTANSGEWQHQTISYESNQVYAGELKAFLNSATAQCPPQVDLQDGHRTLKVALQAHKSSKHNHKIQLEPMTE